MQKNSQKRLISGQVILSISTPIIIFQDNIFAVENYMSLKKKFAKEDINNFKKMLEIPEEIDYL